jgi:hypothetical protein
MLEGLKRLSQRLEFAKNLIIKRLLVVKLRLRKDQDILNVTYSHLTNITVKDNPQVNFDNSPSSTLYAEKSLVLHL